MIEESVRPGPRFRLLGRYLLGSVWLQATPTRLPPAPPSFQCLHSPLNFPDRHFVQRHRALSSCFTGWLPPRPPWSSPSSPTTPTSSIWLPHSRRLFCLNPARRPRRRPHPRPLPHRTASPHPPSPIAGCPPQPLSTPWTKADRATCRPRRCRPASSRRVAKPRRSKTGSSARRMSSPTQRVSFFSVPPSIPSRLASPQSRRPC